MAAPSRMTRLGSNQGRMKKRVRYLSQEVERLGNQGFSDFVEEESPYFPQAINDMPKSGSGIEDLFDKVIDITRKWEKILALLALVTTNLSGNKSLAALLEIMAKDRPEFGGAAPGQSNSSDGLGGLGGIGSGGLNLTELLNLAESLLKNSQPQQESAAQPQADPVSVAQEDDEIETLSEDNVEEDNVEETVVETATVLSDETQQDEEAGDLIEADPVA